MVVKTGKGYSLAESNKDEEAPVGTIPIDAVFSPIRRVNYVVGNARVGQRTDYDKLTMEVWTDGSIKPEDAVAYARQDPEGADEHLHQLRGRAGARSLPASRTRAKSPGTTRICFAAWMSWSFRFAAPTA